MIEQIVLCIMYVVNAIENMPEGTEDSETARLYAFCEDQGIPVHRVQELVDTPGDTDAGKVIRAMQADKLDQARNEAKPKTKPKKAPAKAKK